MIDKHEIALIYMEEKKSTYNFRTRLEESGIEIPDNIEFRDKEQTKKRNDLYSQEEELTRYNNFVNWSSYDVYVKVYTKNILAIEDLSLSDLARLIMLSTYVYQNFDLKDDGNAKFLQYSDLKRILKISDRAFKQTYSELTKKSYLIKTDVGYKINSKLFCYGKEISGELSQGRFLKMYCHATRTMYYTLPPTKHKLLGYMIRLIPYAHIEYGVLCKNPTCKKGAKEEYNDSKMPGAIEPLTLDEICNITGYSIENKRRFRKEINSVVFNFKGNDQRFMISAINNETEIFIVNPNVIYGGSPQHRAARVAGYFESLETLTRNVKRRKAEMRKKKNNK